MPSITLDEAQLAALVVESFLNGIFWVLFIQAAQVLYARSKERGDRFFLNPITITGILLFITTVGHWILNTSLAFDAFILDSGAEHPVKAYGLNPYEQIGNPKTTTITLLYVMSGATADGFMAYRLFIVWRRNWLIVIPAILMLIGFLVTGIISTYLYSRSVVGFVPWVTAGATLTFACNLYSTSLIALKIYSAARKEQQSLNYRGGSSLKVFEILVESALLYSSCVLAALVTYLVKSNLQYILIYLISPVVGIIFSMIVTRGNQSVTSQSMKKSSFVDLQPASNFKSASARDRNVPDMTYGEETSASKGEGPWNLA